MSDNKALILQEISTTMIRIAGLTQEDLPLNWQADFEEAISKLSKEKLETVAYQVRELARHSCT